jgi:hypothetical protein
MGIPAGILTNGGIWPSINGTLIWGLAMVDGKLAWDEWKKNSLAAHAEAYPDVWYGIWSGPDSYNSVLSSYPGQTMFFDHSPGKPAQFDWGVNWTDFPVMNLHPHAWQLYSIVKLLGLDFHELGLRFAPVIPVEEYEFTSPLLGFKKTARGYSGWYAPSVAGEWTLELRLTPEDAARWKRLEINGAVSTPKVAEQSVIRFAGKSAPGKPLNWSLS